MARHIIPPIALWRDPHSGFRGGRVVSAGREQVRHRLMSMARGAQVITVRQLSPAVRHGTVFDTDVDRIHSGTDRDGFVSDTSGPPRVF